MSVPETSILERVAEHRSTRQIKIGFVLLSNSRNPIPSTRIAVLNMFPFLRANHFEPHIVYEPEQGNAMPNVDGLAPRLKAEGFDIIVFQKVHGPSVESLARQLGEAGIRTVFCVCDVVDDAMAAATDATIVVTDFLRSLYSLPLQAKIHVVHDGIEYPDLYKTDWGGPRTSGKRPLRAVLVTSAHLVGLPQIGTPPSWLDVTIVGRYPPLAASFHRLQQVRWTLTRQHGISERMAYLKFLINRRIRCIPWGALKVYEQMKGADVGIIPIDVYEPPDPDDGSVPSWKVKSENRLSMKMCMALPVVATPIPAYHPLIRQGQNGFLAHSGADWLQYLDALRDPVLRERIGTRARESVMQRYSMGEQAKLLIAILDKLIKKQNESAPG